MKLKSLPFLFTLLVVLILGIYLAVFRTYPVAVVEGSFITARDLERNYSAASQYYKKFILAQASSSPNTDEFYQGLKLEAFRDLVEDRIIADNLNQMFGKETAEALIKKKLSEVGEVQIGPAVNELYGLNNEEFRNMILEPAARNEILNNRLFIDKQDPEAWLQAAYARASVIIFSPEFKWVNGVIELAK